MSEYSVFRVDDANNRLGKVGRVSVGERDELRVIGVEAEAESDLRKAVDNVNGSDGLIWKYPTDEQSESGRSKIRKDRIERGDPRFIRAIQDTFQRWYSLELDLPPEPGAEDDDAEDDQEDEE